MIILDTNVVSALMRPEPDRIVVKWFDQQFQPLVWTTSVTVYEIRFGLELMQSELRRAAYVRVLNDFLENAVYRVAEFDEVAAECAATLSAMRKKEGRPVELRDTMIAGIVIANQATLATRNVKHFSDLSVPVINPWD